MQDSLLGKSAYFAKSDFFIKIRSKQSSNTIFFMRQMLNEEWKSMKSHVDSEIQVKQICINQSVGLFVYVSYNTDCTLTKERLLSQKTKTLTHMGSNDHFSLKNVQGFFKHKSSKSGFECLYSHGLRPSKASQAQYSQQQSVPDLYVLTVAFLALKKIGFSEINFFPKKK